MSSSGKKRILVMMSSYNGEKHIAEQIDSILNQKTEHEVHLRIRDDGSVDGTCGILEKYVSEFPSQVELIKCENKGYNASFFDLMLNAEGFDYYSISDQDDVWLPDKLQIACEMIDSITEDIPVLYASTSYLVHDDLIPYGTTRKKEREMTMYNTIIQNICPGHTQVMNDQLLKQLRRGGGIDTSRIYVYDSWIQNIANLYGIILFDNEPHTYYRQYEGNQLGAGAGKIGRLMVSRKRTDTGDGHKYRRQIEYFLSANAEEMKVKGCFAEIDRFVKAHTVFERCRYVLRSRLYRQNKLESIAFKLAVLVDRF